jgi:hypothetical protein
MPAHCCPQLLPRTQGGAFKLRLLARRAAPNVVEMFTYYRDNRDGVERFKRDAKRTMIALARAGELRQRAA